MFFNRSLQDIKLLFEASGRPHFLDRPAGYRQHVERLRFDAWKIGSAELLRPSVRRRDPSTAMAVMIREGIAAALSGDPQWPS
jgi:hypothetical protein